VKEVKNSFFRSPLPQTWGFFLLLRAKTGNIFFCLLCSALVVFYAGVACAGAQDRLSPQRIISFSPSITEVLFALGAGRRVVGVTDFCLYPREAALLPKVGGLINPSAETIISLRPDLLIYHHDSDKIKNFAQRLGVQSLGVSFGNLTDIYQTIKKIGDVLGEQEAAKQLLETLQDKIRFYRTRIQGLKSKSVLLILGDSDDPMRDLYAVGKGTFLDELLTLAGGQNILSASPASYPKVSREFIISASPEIIIVAGPKVRFSTAELRERKKQWGRFTTVRAVKNNNIYYIGADYILIPGPRLTKIVEKFAAIIHPEILAEKSPAAGATENVKGLDDGK